MSAHRKSRKIVPVAAVLGLMGAAAIGGYVVSGSSTPENGPAAQTLQLAGEQGGSVHQVTVFACLQSGRLTRVTAGTAPSCPGKSVLVQWTVQSGAPEPANPTPTVAPATSAPATSAPSSPAPSSKPTMTTSSPVTPSPSPSPTSQGPTCVTSASGGTCGPYAFPGISGSGSWVIQDVWNPISGASQKLTAITPGDWSVSADMPAGNKAVVSYPDTQQVYTRPTNTPNPLTGYASITSSYNESAPTASGDDYEAAYDIWAGDGNNDGTQEIMIWVDNHGQRPAGNDVASTTIDGVGYQIYSTAGAGAVGRPVSMMMDSNQSSGSVNILDDLNWLKSNGYMPSDSGINQIDFGWEICSTAGVPATFTMSQYSLKATCTSGSGCTP